MLGEVFVPQNLYIIPSLSTLGQPPLITLHAKLSDISDMPRSFLHCAVTYPSFLYSKPSAGSSEGASLSTEDGAAPMLQN